MLTDIFADRYINVQMWDEFRDVDKRFLVQGFRMINEQLYPYWVDGKESPTAKVRWTSIHDKLSMELGMAELSKKCYSYQTKRNGQPYTNSGVRAMDSVCKDFVCASYDASISADRFIKERISFIELAFRERDNEINIINKDLSQNILAAKDREAARRMVRPRTPESIEDRIRSSNKTLNKKFRDSIHELNERLRRAGYNLNYHNGFIQISDDGLIEEQVKSEFWILTRDSLWENVDLDMKEAIDMRDSNSGDPAFYAARALESTVKIISNEKGWTHGKENGAHNFIENLSSKKNGAFISEWERDTLKKFFTDVRNPFGHGAGSEDMPKLNKQQTDWAIETCMCWVKSLVKRI